MRKAVPMARPAVVDLSDPHAADRELTGNKAAALARASSLDLPVLPGFVVTTAWAPPGAPTEGIGELRAAWGRLSHGGEIALVVRSSSTIEDVEGSSMAGRFRSVLDVLGWTAFLDAVGDVRGSARVDGGEPDPMAVLVQPQLRAACGGVMFGLDPVTGDRRRVVVEAVSGGPDALVSGRATAARYLLSRAGRVVEVDERARAPLARGQRRRLVRLARKAERVFGAPQDIEWAIDGDGHLWLLQSRPITAAGGAATATGPLLGPGPVAETFPEPLRRLEVELFVEPLRAGIVRAMRVVGMVPRRRTTSSPVVTTVGGRVAADLELFGMAPTRRSAWRFLNPIPPARHLAVAWRIGRLRRDLPRFVADLLRRTDVQLASVPALDVPSDRELVWLLQRVRRQLRAIHGHEVLAGMLLPKDERGPTAAAVALDVISRARGDDLSQERIVAAHPEVLALTPPRVGRPARLPDAGGSPDLPPEPRAIRLGHREALRLRARWCDELAARAARELGCRLARAGRLPTAGSVRELSLVELTALVAGDREPADLEERIRSPSGPPLPAVFRLTPEGAVAPARLPRRKEGEGRGAGGGRGVGRVHQLSEGPLDEEGEVLVVRVLEPSLAASLPHVSGLVAETGSTLSHLAILAREVNVPTVVGVEDALQRYPPGTLVLVDGTTGEVQPIVEEVSA